MQAARPRASASMRSAAADHVRSRPSARYAGLSGNAPAGRSRIDQTSRGLRTVLPSMPVMISSRLSRAAVLDTPSTASTRAPVRDPKVSKPGRMAPSDKPLNDAIEAGAVSGSGGQYSSEISRVRSRALPFDTILTGTRVPSGVDATRAVDLAAINRAMTPAGVKA